MLDTLASSQRGGGGREFPPAPPAYEGDMPWEKRAIDEAEYAVGGRVDLRKTAPFLAHLALPRAVFGVDEPLHNRVAPFGKEHYDTIHSVN